MHESKECAHPMCVCVWGGGVLSFIFDTSDPVKTDWSLTDIQSYVVEALFQRVFSKVLQLIKLILNTPEIKQSYSRYAKLKCFKLQ